MTVLLSIVDLKKNGIKKRIAPLSHCSAGIVEHCDGAGTIETEPMTQKHFSITVEIPAPAALVWSVMADVERWSEWTASVSRIKRLSPRPLQVGSRLRIHQPKLPPALWRVTELTPDEGFTGVSVAPGVRVTARHQVEAIATGSRVTLSIRYEGLLSGLLARWTGELNERYLGMEANGLKARCTDLANNRKHD
jgi:hypothetical protein